MVHVVSGSAGPGQKALLPQHHHRLAEASWVSALPTMACFGQRWTIRTTDPELADYLYRLYEPVVAVGSSGNPTVTYSVLPPTRDRAGLVARDDELLLEPASHGATLSGLVWVINRQVIEETRDRLLLHATAAARDGRAVVLVGQPNVGKTTLLTGLLARGFDYVTDEVVAVTADGQIEGFPKPLTIDRGSWEVLDYLRPQVTRSMRRYLQQQWQLPLQTLARIAASSCAEWLVFPRFWGTADTRLVALSPGAAVRELVPCMFAPPDEPLGLSRLRTLTSLAERTPAWRLEYSELDHAAQQLAQLAQDEP